MSLRRCRRSSGLLLLRRRVVLSLDELVRRDACPTRGGSTALARWAGDREHYVRRPLAWYLSAAWRRRSGL